MLTVFDPPRAASERSGIERANIRQSVRIAQKDQKSIRINPTRSLACATAPRPSTSTACAADALGDAPASTPALRHIPSLRCQVLPPRLGAPAAVAGCPGRNGLLFRMDGWWSQTGSNRRPQACKASALPTELWPRTRRAHCHISGELVQPAGPTQGMWWAWEDLNFRPHAYQARALTN